MSNKVGEHILSTHFGDVKIGWDSEGVWVTIPGHSTKTAAADEDDAVIYIELSDFLEYPRVLAWGDINDEDWTDEITIGPAARHEAREDV